MPPNKHTREAKLRTRPDAGLKGAVCISRVSSSARGFALVVALGLMAFLLVLILGLTSLIQVDMQASTVASKNIQARQNAYLGLMMALGQLQELAGPDQRITAQADILADVHPDKQFWTGVWRSDDDLGPVDWLVSWPAGADGAATIPSVTDPLPANANDLVELVGAGSAVESVRVPKIRVAGENASSIGHFAYWVGDEGVKAKVNLTNPYRNDDTDSSTYRASVKTPLRNGAEQMAGLSFLGDGDADVRDAALTRLVNPNEMRLVADAVGSPVNEQDIRSHYFDYNTTSAGVLTNVRDGGLKIDLTRALRDSDSSIGPYGTRIFDQGPYWSLLLDYYWNLRVDPDDPELNLRRRPFRYAGSWDPSLYHRRWTTEHGVTPVLVASELSMGLVYNYNAPLVEGLARFTVAPIVVLANPYDARISEARYVIRYLSFNSSGSHLTPQVSIRIDGVDLIQSFEKASGSSSAIHINRLLPPNADGLRGVSLNDLKFEIQTSFEPGEIKIFTLGEIQEYFTSDEDPVLLAEGYNSDSYAWVRPDAGQEPALVVPPRDPGEPPATLRISSPSLYRSIALYRMNPDQPFSADGENLVHVQPYMTPFGSAPTTFLSTSTDKQVRELIWLKGSTSNETYSRNSPVNTLAHFNVRAPRHISFFQDSGHFASSYLYAARADYQLSQFDELNLWEPDAFIGFDGDTPRYAMPLFHALRQGETFHSLAELQHVDFSLHSVAPSYAVGNSWAHPFIDPDKVLQTGSGGNGYGGSTSAVWLDLSWHLNNALWDNYFFSTLLAPGDINNPGSMSNPRMHGTFKSATPDIEAALAEPEQAAAYLMVDGAFNVNSTSVEAWMAVLSGNQGVDIAYTDTTSMAGGEDDVFEGEPELTAFLRSAFPMGGLSDDEQDEFWRGFSAISNATDAGGDDPSELRLLAELIVEEVRARGPFRSLGEFVNRKPGSDIELALRGPLQAAIDRSSVNADGRPEQRFGSTLSAEPAWNFPEAVKRDSDLGMSGFRGKGAPGDLTQADVLTAIGPYLSVRSDTFIIRAYGDVSSPFGGDDAEEARAWCEAVVQRMPEYVDPANMPWVSPDDPALSATNAKMGRKFKIISFRWLTEDEI